jgi:hypothetical protein
MKTVYFGCADAPRVFLEYRDSAGGRAGDPIEVVPAHLAASVFRRLRQGSIGFAAHAYLSLVHPQAIA